MSLTKTKFIAASRKRQFTKIEKYMHPKKPIMTINEIVECIDEIKDRKKDDDLMTYQALLQLLIIYYDTDSIAKSFIDKNDLESLAYINNVGGIKVTSKVHEYAANKGRFDALIYMLDAKSYIKIRDALMRYNFVRDDNYPRDSFMIALRQFDYKFIKKLLNEYPDLAGTNDNFAICYACEYGDKKMVKLLLACKYVDLAVNENFPIKIVRAYRHDSIMIELLKHERVDVNEIDLDLIETAIKTGYSVNDTLLIN